MVSKLETLACVCEIFSCMICEELFLDKQNKRGGDRKDFKSEESHAAAGI